MALVLGLLLSFATLVALVVEGVMARAAKVCVAIVGGLVVRDGVGWEGVVGFVVCNSYSSGVVLVKGTVVWPMVRGFGRV